MKKSTPFIAALLILISLLSSSCSKDDSGSDSKILYPDSGFYGKNILNTTDSIYQYDAGPEYADGYFSSMKAILPSIGSSLTVEITGTRVMVFQNQSWFTNTDYSHTENTSFRAEGLITADLKIYLFDGGEATIKLYENDSEIPTRIKRIIKQN